MSATYFNRQVEVVKLYKNGEYEMVDVVFRNIREGRYRSGRHLARYQKQWWPVTLREDGETFMLVIATGME